MGKNRADVCLRKLADLNERVKLDRLHSLSDESILQYKVLFILSGEEREERRGEDKRRGERGERREEPERETTRET